jgi:hypothetical protein
VRSRCAALALGLALCAAAPLSAQDTKSRHSAGKRAAPVHTKAKKAKQASATANASAAPGAPAPSKPRPEAVPPKAAHPPPSAAARAVDEEDVRKEGNTEIKTVEFTGLDIEGQLKTPQMLYFLNRLRAEFDRPRLPHRSFMPELSRSTKEKDF